MMPTQNRFQTRSPGEPIPFRGSWHLYGHSHGRLPDDPLALSMDVGVDTHDFRPWHFDEIKERMKERASRVNRPEPPGYACG